MTESLTFCGETFIIASIRRSELKSVLFANVKKGGGYHSRTTRPSPTLLNPTGGGNATSMPKTGIP